VNAAWIKRKSLSGAGVSVSIRERNGGRIYLDAYYSGRHHWITTGLTRSSDKIQDKEVLKLAESMRSMEEQRLAAGEWGLTVPGRERIGLVEYAKEVAATKAATHHIHKAMPYLEKFAGEIQLRAVTADWLDDYKAYLLGQEKLAQVTASHYYSALVHVFHRAVRAKIIVRSPTEDTRGIPEPEPEKPHLTPDEVAKLAAHPLGGELGYEIYRGFLFACLVGLRVSDVTAFTYGQIIMQPKPHIVRRQVKTKEIVSVPVVESAMKIIGKVEDHKATDRVFPRLAESKTSPTQYFRVWAKDAGVEKKVGWHMSRHTFAVRLLEEGVDIYTVSKLLGHSDIKTTMSYAKATEGMRRAAVEKLPEIKLEGKREKRKARKKAP